MMVMPYCIGFKGITRLIISKCNVRTYCKKRKNCSKKYYNYEKRKYQKISVHFIYEYITLLKYRNLSSKTNYTRIFLLNFDIIQLINFSMNNSIVITKNLRKTFTTKKSKQIVEAVKGINLDVKKGQVFGFLGPNGAGKTTTLQMLTTLLAPTSGEATVVGFDLLKTHQKIREHIGYVSQAGGADTSTNAIENLILQARLYGTGKLEAEKRANELIERFEISEFAQRKVTSYSGGQKRRLDLALGVVHRPQLLFLDEPTTGLDPQS